MAKCIECGAATAGAAKLCCSPCRKAWHNRRAMRGAELYDLFMAMRYERDEAKRLGVWAELCRLTLRYHEEDENDRQGRRSYEPPAIVLDRLRSTGRLQMGDTLGGRTAAQRRREERTWSVR